ncbi:MAG TPA: alpha-N-arabinofuranosidase [Lentisphaeria bacterium]|nr:MAG: alpha-N-arabinofuranosidase [Lentisphaerae bacterium GWF2_50_93]HCE44425.1 alpha-N-arabinofuranosidase [Lentisphaeria bacterium]
MKARIAISRAFAIDKVDPRIYSGFIEHLGRAVYEGIYEPGHPTADKDGFRQDVIDLVRELDMPLTRYPGGNFVSGYSWTDGIGPKNKRPARRELAWMALEPNQVGVNEFVQWCRKANTSPMMAVNLGTGGADDARNIVEYCNVEKGSHWSDLRRAHGFEKPHGIKTWCLGNEMDGPWQIGHKNAVDYGKLARETAKVMKLTDPSIELVACGSSSLEMPEFARWEEQVLTECFNHVEYISLHSYFGNSENDTPLFLSKPDRMNEFIRKVAATCDFVSAKLKSKKRINISFDEWNVWFHSGRKDKKVPQWICPRQILEDVYTMEDALVVGGILISLLNNADRVKIACIAQTVNVIAPIMTAKGGAAWRQTIFYPFMHASKYGRGTVLRQAVESPEYRNKDGKSPYLHSAVVLNEGKKEIAIFAVNRSIDKELELSVDLSSFGGTSVAEWIVMQDRNLKSSNTLKNRDNVVPSVSNDATVKNGILKASLGKASWNVIRVKIPG